MPALAPSESTVRMVATDANVVINFVHAGILDDLPSMVDMDFVMTDEVYEEILRPEQRQIVDSALLAGTWTRESLTEPSEIALFAALATRLGRGEAASLALAVSRTCRVASDERRVFLREARQRLGEKRIVDTPGLLVLAIRRGTLTIAEADRIKELLETRRFVMRFRSFADLMK